MQSAEPGELVEHERQDRHHGQQLGSPEVDVDAPGVVACSSVLCAISWNSAGIAHRNGTTASNSSTSEPLQTPILDEMIGAGAG